MTFPSSRPAAAARGRAPRRWAGPLLAARGVGPAPRGDRLPIARGAAWLAVGPRRAAAAALAALVAAPALAGCGDSTPDPGPREAAAAFLERLATGDARAVCRSLTATAVAELARDFGGATCAQTAARAAGYVAARPAVRASIRGVTILPTLDIPLSPAPHRAGTRTAALRLVVDDPVLGSRQALDVRLRLVAGRWRVDEGVNALITRVRAREKVRSARG